MNDQTPIEPTPNGPVTEPVVESPDDARVARNFVHHEYEEARKSLQKTMIGSVVIAAILCGYTIYLTSRFRASLEPQEAATIAKGLINQRVQEQGPEIKEYIKREVPNYIRQAPDLAIRELPHFRERVQSQVDDSVKKFASESSARFETQFDKFLDDHKDAVGKLLKDGQDPAATKEMTEALKASFIAFLEDSSAGGESLKSKIDQSLEMLKRVDERMRRLANGKELTPQEVSARRAIAVLLRTVDDKRTEEGHTDAIAPKAIDEARARVEPAVNSAANTASNAAGG